MKQAGNRFYCSGGENVEHPEMWQHFSPPRPDTCDPKPYSPDGMCPHCGAELVVISEFVESYRGDYSWHENIQVCTSCLYQSEPYYDVE